MRIFAQFVHANFNIMLVKTRFAARTVTSEFVGSVIKVHLIAIMNSGDVKMTTRAPMFILRSFPVSLSFFFVGISISILRNKCITYSFTVSIILKLPE